MTEALNVLTGMPTKMFLSKNFSEDQLFEMIKEYDGKQWVMVCSTDGSITDGAIDGLLKSHAHTVLGAKQITKDDGTPIKMIKIMNPEGFETYSGDYNDNDPKWTQKMRDQLGHTRGNDGVYWMPVSSFKKDFADLIIAMYEDWQKKILKESWNRKTFDAVWSFNNPVNQDAVISIQT